MQIRWGRGDCYPLSCQLDGAVIYWYQGYSFVNRNFWRDDVTNFPLLIYRKLVSIRDCVHLWYPNGPLCVLKRALLTPELPLRTGPLSHWNWIEMFTNTTSPTRLFGLSLSSFLKKFRNLAFWRTLLRPFYMCIIILVCPAFPHACYWYTCSMHLLVFSLKFISCLSLSHVVGGGFLVTSSRHLSVLVHLCIKIVIVVAVAFVYS